jgi:hypothetical protein
MRKFIPFFLLASVLAVPGAQGQIDVNCALAHPRFLQYEPLVVTLKIANHMGEPIELSGAGPDARIAFDIEESPGVLVESSDQPLLETPVRIQPQDSADVKLNLLGPYRIRRSGPYTISARVRWGGKVFISPRVFADVLPGMEIAKMVSGMPGGKGMRTYTLRTLSRDRSEHVFLRIDDEDQNTCYGVFDLGTIVRLYTPRMTTDGLGHLHILYQSSPWKYSHTEFTPDGRPVNQEIYSSQSPTLTMDRGEDGMITIEGAERDDSDLEPEADLSEENPPPEKDSQPVAR